MSHLTCCRNGQSISANAWLPQSDTGSWNFSGHHLPSNSTLRDPHPTIRSKSSIGVTISYLVTSLDAAVDDGGLCVRMDRRRTVKKIVQSASWYWTDYIHSGAVPVLLRLVDVSQGKETPGAI